MFLSREMFGKGIAKIISSWLLKDLELLLLLSIFEPMVFYINTFYMSFLNGTIYESLCCYIINLDRCRRLGMAHFDEGMMNDYGVLAILKSTSYFVFNSRRNYIFKYFRESVYRSVEMGSCFWEVRYKITKKEIATNSAFGIGFYKICSIAMYPQYHVGGCKGD